ncbi:hypothetical protein [Actinomadura fibrosa]|uniref:Uncharacterized protein n=1 Tax=Actinomadura fibrosa TaxID=111802 RepID=A0ABW2XL06_9ACTN|nr:hypothetical protein [Actinomadura fibrosa]
MDHSAAIALLIVVIIETSLITGFGFHWLARKLWKIPGTGSVALGVGSFWGMLGTLFGVAGILR